MARLVITVEGANAEKALANLKRQAEALGGSVKKLDGPLDRAKTKTTQLASAAKLLAGAFAAVQLKRFASFAVEAAADYERLKVRLETVTGSQQKANAAFAGIEKFAKSTPFQLNEITDAYVRLAALGIQPTEERLRSFGNTASAMGKTILQFSEAVIDAQVGEFERLKEFGIKVRTEGDTLAVRFGDTTRRIANDGREIVEILEEIGNTKFAGATEREAQTLSGQMSTLRDNARSLSAMIGETLTPTIKALTTVLNESTASFNKWIAALNRAVAAPARVGEAAVTFFSKLMAGRGAYQIQRDDLGTLRNALHEVAVGFEEKARLAFERFLESLSKGKSELGGGGGGGGPGLNGALEDFNEQLEAATDNLLSVAEKGRNAGTVMAQIRADISQPLPVGGGFGLPGQIDELPDVVSDQQIAETASKFEGLGQQIFGILSGAIVSALQGDGVNYQQLASALGTVIGNAIAPGVGGAVGGLIGSVVGGLFGGGGRSGPSFADQFNAVVDRIEQMVASVEPTVGNVRSTFEEIRQLAVDTMQIGADAEAAFAAAQRKIIDLRNEILGIDVEGFGERLRAAFAFNQEIGLIPYGQLGGGLGTGAGGRDREDSGGGGLLALSPALDQAAGSAAEFTSVLGEQSEIYEVAGIQLENFASQLVAEFEGVDFGFMSVTASAQALRDAIVEMGFDADTTARLLDQLADAEARRMQELETDVLQRLVNILQQIPGMQQEAARIQQQINQARFQIEVEMINMQLRAMGLMTAAFESMINAAREFGADVGNFRAPRVPNVRVGGGRSRGGGRGRRQERQREREALLDTLERLASSTAFNTLNDRLSQLMDDFFGPGGFADEARRLGVDMNRVTEAFRVQRQILFDQANRPIRDFLASLETSGLAPGGLGARFGAAQQQFSELLNRAQGGDLDARADLASSAQTLLDLARQRFGNTRRYQRIFERVQGQLEGIVGDGPTSIDGRKIRIAEESRDLLKIIAGVDTAKVLPFRREDSLAAQEVRRLRDQNAQLIDLQARREAQWHRERQEEARKLREEFAKQNEGPKVHRVSSSARRL